MIWAISPSARFPWCSENLDGKLTTPTALVEADNVILEQARALLPECREAMDIQAPHNALNAIWNVVSEANRYFAAQEPWALKKTDPQRMSDVLYVTAEIVRRVAVLSQPFMPDAAARLLDALAVPSEERNFDALDTANTLTSGTIITKPEGIFPRFVEPVAVN